MSVRAKAYLFLLITVVIWGSATPIIKYTTNFIPPSVFLLYRFFLSSTIALFFLPSLRKVLPKTPKAWMITLFYGFLVSTVSLLLLFMGTAYSSSLVSAIVGTTDPLMATLAGMIFLKEHVTRQEKTGIFIALGGSLLITFEPLIKTGLVSGTFVGNLFLILSRVTDVASSIIAKTLLRLNISPLALTHLAFITGFFTLLPIVLFTHTPANIFQLISTIPLSAHLGVFYMAFLSGTLAYTLWHKAQKSIEVGEASVSFYLHPLMTIPLAIFWLQETITPIFVVGCLVIAFGVIIAQYRRSLFNSSRR